ncbi:hypothetical protein THAOC_25966, partial [Thalassiosira oceanica]
GRRSAQEGAALLPLRGETYLKSELAPGEILGIPVELSVRPAHGRQRGDAGAGPGQAEEDGEGRAGEAHVRRGGRLQVGRRPRPIRRHRRGRLRAVLVPGSRRHAEGRPEKVPAGRQDPAPRARPERNVSKAQRVPRRQRRTARQELGVRVEPGHQPHRGESGPSGRDAAQLPLRDDVLFGVPARAGAGWRNEWRDSGGGADDR